MVVEDDPITRFMMEEICHQIGYQNEMVESGVQCLKLLQEQPARADVILMDIHMPGLSGLDVCETIRNRQFGLPESVRIIAVTADEFWHDPIHCAAAGFDTVIAKPISMKALRRTLDPPPAKTAPKD